MRLARSITALMVVAVTVSMLGCVVEAEGPPRCRGGAWIEGHYGPRGYWHRGHWRCPNEVEVVEVR